MTLKKVFIIAHKSLRSVDITRKKCYNISIDGKEITPLKASKTSGYIFFNLLTMELLNLKQVANRYVVSTKTITRKVSAGIMPAPIVLWERSDGTSAANRWREQDLIKFDAGEREWKK